MIELGIPCITDSLCKLFLPDVYDIIDINFDIAMNEAWPIEYSFSSPSLSYAPDFSHYLYSLDQELVFVIESERAMERYLERHGQNPRDIDHRIWLIHFRATKKKQMGVLNLYFDQLLAQKKILYSYMPHEMLLANVYRTLKIPYKWNSQAVIAKPDIAKEK